MAESGGTGSEIGRTKSDAKGLWCLVLAAASRESPPLRADSGDGRGWTGSFCGGRRQLHHWAARIRKGASEAVPVVADLGPPERLKSRVGSAAASVGGVTLSGSSPLGPGKLWEALATVARPGLRASRPWLREMARRNLEPADIAVLRDEAAVLLAAD